MPFEKVDTQVDFPALERRSGVLGRARVPSKGSRAESRQKAVVVPRRPDHGQQSHGRASCLGPDLQGPLPALFRHDRPRAALPERLRLPGAVGRGRSRKGNEAAIEARHRKPRARRHVSPASIKFVHGMQKPRRQVRRSADGAVDPPGLLDGLGPRARTGRSRPMSGAATSRCRTRTITRSGRS